MGHPSLAPFFQGLDAQQGTREVLRDLADGTRLTMGELLDSAGVARFGDAGLVALTPGSSTAEVTAVVAALRAGRPFLPVDPRLPAPARDRLLRRAGAVPTDRTHEAGGRTPHLPDDLAYAVATSGTTGEPKVAMLGATGLAAYLAAISSAYELSTADVVLQGAPFGFDVWFEEVLPTLSSGARIVRTGRGLRLSYREFGDLVRQHGVTVLNLPSGYWHGWVDYLEQTGATVPGSVRLVVVGSERVSASAAHRWSGLRGHLPRLVAAYGLVEATVTSLLYDVTAEGLPAGEQSVPLGRPLSPALARTTVDDVGELLLGGDTVLLSYLDDATATEACLSVDEHGVRWLRTGDHVDRRADGVLCYRGRRDDQVKVSGFRVSLSDVAAHIERLTGVRQAAIVQPVPGGPVMAAVAAGPGVDETGLKERLRAELPPYQVPSLIAVSDSLPVRSNGKIDLGRVRDLLIAPAPESRPGNDLDARSAVLVTAGRLLGREVDGSDGFVGAGGNSLLAVRLTAELEMLGWDVELLDVFDTATFEELAGRLRPGDGAPALLRPTGACQGPLTQQQLAVWYHTIAYPDSRAYHAQSRLDIEGPLDVERLRTAVEHLARRHAVLRTSFHEGADGVPYQRVEPAAGIRFSTVDLAASGRSVEDVQHELIGEPFDLGQAPLARWTLVDHDTHRHTLFLVEHHLVHDGVSFALLMQELRDLMASSEPRAGQPVGIEYLDYAIWQDERIRAGDFADKVRRRVDVLRDVPPLARMTRAAPGDGRHDGGVCIRYLDADLAAAARDTAHRLDTTLFVFLLTVFATVVADFCEQQRFAVGVSVANRRLSEVDRTVGMFVNTVPIPFDCADRGLRALVRDTHEVATRAYADQDVPFPLLVRALAPRWTPNSTPVYQVMCSFDDAPLPEMRWGRTRAEVVELQSGYAKVDLSVVAVPQKEQRRLVGEAGGREDIKLIFQYRRATVSDAEAARFAEQLLDALRSATRSPNKKSTTDVWITDAG